MVKVSSVLIADVGVSQAERDRSAVESLREISADNAREYRRQDDKRWDAEVVVTVLVPELRKVRAESDDGLLSLSISERTQGICVGDLRPGQHLKVTLQGVLAPKVLSATLA